MTKLLMGVLLLMGRVSWAAGPFAPNQLIHCSYADKQPAFTFEIGHDNDAYLIDFQTGVTSDVVFVNAVQENFTTHATYDVQSGGRVILSQTVTLDKSAGALGCGRFGCDEIITWSAKWINSSGSESQHSCVERYRP